MRDFNQAVIDATNHMVKSGLNLCEVSFSVDGLNHNYTDFRMQILKVEFRQGNFYRRIALASSYIFSDERMINDFEMFPSTVKAICPF